MSELAQINKKIVLYGAGVQNVRFAFWFLAPAGLEVERIVDKDPQKQGSFCYETEIVPPDWLIEQDRNGEAYLVIITARTPKVVEEIKAYLADLKYADVYSIDEFLKSGSELRRKTQKLFSIMVHVTDHCNLKCAYCSHFSPLVMDGQYLNEDNFERDLKRLHQLTGGDIAEVQLLGGEPLLHPKLYCFPRIIRKYFPRADIVLVTNGLKLSEMPQIFFDTCKSCRVQIWITQYPIDFDYDGTAERLKSEGIDVQFSNTGNSREQCKVMEKLPLRLTAGMDAQTNFDHCVICQSYPLRDGRLYPCPPAAYIDFFNDYFHEQMPALEANGVDLFAVKDLQELTDKLSCPVPLCAHCDCLAPPERVAWSVSKRDISEWTI